MSLFCMLMVIVLIFCQMFIFPLYCLFHDISSLFSDKKAYFVLSPFGSGYLLSVFAKAFNPRASLNMYRLITKENGTRPEMLMSKNCIRYVKCFRNPFLFLTGNAVIVCISF